MLGPIGWPELAIIFVIVLILFGPKSLPKIGQALGKGIREFKDAAKGLTSGLQDDEEEVKPRPNATTPPSTPLFSEKDTTASKSGSESESKNHV